MPEHVFVHGFLLGADGRKMSKSLGNVLDPFEVIDSLGTDALRFYLMRDVAFGGDGAVGIDAVTSRYENELANEYGNLASRTIAMIVRYRDSRVPAVATDPAIIADFAGLPGQLAALLDRAEATQALELIWQRVRRLNRYVEERAPWQLAKDPAQAGALDETLASLHEGIRAISVLLHPYMPASVERLLAALGATERSYAAATLRPHRRRRRRRDAAAAVPEALIDSHTHLHLCEPPDSELVEAAFEAGVHRIVTVGTSGPSNRLALEAAERFPQVYAAIGAHPNEATGFDDADLAELEALAAHERCVAIGETGLDYYRDYAPADDQRRAFLAQIELAREVGKPLVIHTRAADDETIATLREHASGVTVILHCFSMADRVAECLEQSRWFLSFAGNVTFPKAQALREAMLRVPTRPAAGRDRRSLSGAAGGAGQTQPARARRPHRAGDRRGAARELRRARTGGRRDGRGGVRVVKLGQNFLVDRNILDVIERLAALSGEDVVLEVGGGLGVLSERLAERAGFVHVVELDAGLEPDLRAVLAPYANWELHIDDALDIDLADARARAREDGREPALRCRGDRDPAHDRRAADDHPLGRDGPARGGGAVRGEARRCRLRAPVGAGAARVRRQGPAPGRSRGLPARAECRLRAARSLPPGWLAGHPGGAGARP